MENRVETIKRWCTFTYKDTPHYSRMLFSGRFDPAHFGHWISVLKLLKVANTVVIVVLDYPGRNYYAGYSCQLFEEAAKLSGFSPRVEVHVNKKHFSEVEIEDVKRYHCDCYAAAQNFEVLNNLWGLMPCFCLDRSYDYDAHRYIPKWKDLKKEGDNMTQI